MCHYQSLRRTFPQFVRRAWIAAALARKKQAIALVASVANDERPSNGSAEFDTSMRKHCRFSREACNARPDRCLKEAVMASA